jgi:hypothetical protein
MQEVFSSAGLTPAVAPSTPATARERGRQIYNLMEAQPSHVLHNFLSLISSRSGVNSTFLKLYLFTFTKFFRD